MIIPSIFPDPWIFPCDVTPAGPALLSCHPCGQTVSSGRSSLLGGRAVVQLRGLTLKLANRAEITLTELWPYSHLLHGTTPQVKGAVKHPEKPRNQKANQQSSHSFTGPIFLLVSHGYSIYAKKYAQKPSIGLFIVIHNVPNIRCVFIWQVHDQCERSQQHDIQHARPCIDAYRMWATILPGHVHGEHLARRILDIPWNRRTWANRPAMFMQLQLEPELLQFDCKASFWPLALWISMIFYEGFLKWGYLRIIMNHPS